MGPLYYEKYPRRVCEELLPSELQLLPAYYAISLEIILPSSLILSNLDSFISMVIMYELSSVFESMNSFAQSDFLLPQMNDINLSPFGKHGKFRSHVACRNGLSKTNSQSVTRKKHSKEVEFERKSSQCQIQEQQSDRYKIMNLLHQVNATKKTLDNNDVVRHCEETTETKIFIMEQRYGTVPARVAQMMWDRLKKLVGKASPISPSKGRKYAVTGKGDENGFASKPNMVGLVIDEKPLEEIALNANGANECSDAGAIKKKKHFFKKFVTKGKRLEASEKHENVFQPIQSVSDIVNDVQTKNRLFELIDANQKGIYELPQVQCKTNEQSASIPQSDHNTVKKFFIMKFILARKKPSVPTQT
ncbi:hypothetical protein V9T40_008335 [Parthenolecanium corni]|uniref:Uncharacterized protein n=1 Tax=Parthenolecanium corni TaxID=536013 RepID=A0AAN9TKP9_9HEMI